MTSTALACPLESEACCCVEEILRDRTADEIHAAVYAEFMHGFGEVPGLDLGAPIRFTRAGSIYRQEFERGTTVANVGRETVDFFLGRGYLDLEYVLCRYVLLPPHSARVLVKPS